MSYGTVGKKLKTDRQAVATTQQRALYEGLYRTMLRIRLCEESFVEPILKREIRCPVHLYSGQEAIATGVCAWLQQRDFVFGTHRSHGHYLAKGAPLQELVAEIYCRETGCCKGRGGSMHLTHPEYGILGVAPIVAGTIALGTGAALASRIRRDGRVTVSFFGDGAVGEGVLAEAMNFASLHRLPILFVCENNQYSTHLPILECRPKNNIVEMARPYGITAKRVDGNNVLQVYKEAGKAIASCRDGSGPAFLECITYRLRGHVGPDDNVQGTHTDIRPAQERERWQKLDPIPRFERLLIRQKVLTRQMVAKIREEIQCEVDDAHEYARSSAFPKSDHLMSYVFKESNSSV